MTPGVENLGTHLKAATRDCLEGAFPHSLLSTSKIRRSIIQKLLVYLLPTQSMDMELRFEDHWQELSSFLADLFQGGDRWQPVGQRPTSGKAISLRQIDGGWL